MLKKVFIYELYILKLMLAYPAGLFCYLFKKGYRDVWLIADRGKDAGDNGYHLFKYISENHPEINIYYVIDYKSPDYNKVEKIGRTVKHKSIKHYILFAISKFKISSHIMGCSPGGWCFANIDKLGIIFGKKVFLQHGITKDNLPQLYYPKIKLDLFVCGAYPEYQYIKDKFNHPNGVVQNLGFARFDELNVACNLRKQILLMPTWRMYISSCSNDQEFTKTEYFSMYQSLINNENLYKILIQYGYTLIFYPHFEVQKYVHSFNTAYKNITIASFENHDVQELLKESSVLITDFSSIFFDFAYMKKPVLFYQFDKQGYRERHYSEGYFSYVNDGFGPIATEENHLIQDLEAILKNGSVVESKYLDRINSFFTTNDSNNCKRNFEAIKNLKEIK